MEDAAFAGHVNFSTSDESSPAIIILLRFEGGRAQFAEMRSPIHIALVLGEADKGIDQPVRGLPSGIRMLVGKPANIQSPGLMFRVGVWGEVGEVRPGGNKPG